MRAAPIAHQQTEQHPDREEHDRTAQPHARIVVLQHADPAHRTAADHAQIVDDDRVMRDLRRLPGGRVGENQPRIGDDAAAAAHRTVVDRMTGQNGLRDHVGGRRRRRRLLLRIAWLIVIGTRRCVGGDGLAESGEAERRGRLKGRSRHRTGGFRNVAARIQRGGGRLRNRLMLDVFCNISHITHI